MKFIKIIMRYLAYTVYLIISVVLILEVTFRVLPTNSPIDLQPITDEKDILRFQPNQTATFAMGADFYQVIKKRTNNYGFYSSHDYFFNSKPNIVIIGDSYIEAAQIRNQDSMAEVLQSEHSELTVYQLGVSGVPLSQYIQMIRYAKREFSPQHFAILVVGNDFDQSLCHYRIKEGTWCFNDDFELIFNPFFGYKGLRSFARKSAVLRYIVFQVGFDWRKFIANVRINDSGLKTKPQHAGNTERFKSDEIANKSRIVIKEFFKELDKMNLTNKVTIIIDADRNDIYRKVFTKSYFDEMREYMMEEATNNGVKYIDMNPIFQNDFTTFNQRFDFPMDGHWNVRAHKLAAQELFNAYFLAR